jgi:hypothetical protein
MPTAPCRGEFEIIGISEPDTMNLFVNVRPPLVECHIWPLPEPVMPSPTQMTSAESATIWMSQGLRKVG